jgi:hypothetical protein
MSHGKVDMNDSVKKMCEEPVVAYFKVKSQNFEEGNEKRNIKTALMEARSKGRKKDE